jgi:hypothetical protein
MKKALVISGAISLVLAFVIFLVDLTKFEFFVGATNVKIYPAAFFGLLGLVLISRGFWKHSAV